MHRFLTSQLALRLQSGLALTILAGTACSQSPTAPSNTSTGSVPSVLNARPSGPSPTSYAHLLDFLPPALGPDGYSPGSIYPGAGNLVGSFTGSPSTGNLLGTASGTATLTIDDVGPLPPGASTPGPCPEGRQLLAAAGIFDVPLSGSLTMSVDQDGSGGGFSHSEMSWQMTNISHGGATWKLNGYSTLNYPAAFAGSATAFTVTLESGAIGFTRYPNGSRKADLSVGCRVDLLMSITRQ